MWACAEFLQMHKVELVHVVGRLKNRCHYSAQLTGETWHEHRMGGWAHMWQPALLLLGRCVGRVTQCSHSAPAPHPAEQHEAVYTPGEHWTVSQAAPMHESSQNRQPQKPWQHREAPVQLDPVEHPYQPR